MLRIKKTYVLNFILAACLILVAIVGSSAVKFVFVSLELVIVALIAKVSYFSFFSFFLWFSFLQEFFADISPLLASGRLRWDRSVPIYYDELFLCLSIFYLIELLIFSTTKVLENEKALYKKKITMTQKMALIFDFVAFIAVILSYPTMPTLSADLARDEGFLPSSLMVPIALVLLASTIDYFKKNKLIAILWIITPLWVLFHGDRVIVFGLAIYIILKYINAYDTRKKLYGKIINKRNIKIFVMGLILIAIGIRIQSTRTGGSYVFNMESFVNSVLKQGTAADITHAFNCATDMWKTGEDLGGYTYLQYIVNCIPMLEDKYSPAMILMDKYNTPELQL